MRNLKTLLIIFILSLLPCSSIAFERIVSTAPSTTEILFALGLGDEVVGVTNFCNYPKQARHKTRIGGNFNFNLETIALIKPTCIIFLKGNSKLKTFCQKMNIRYIEVTYNSLSDIYNSIYTIGKTFGIENKANFLIRNIKMGLNKVVSKVDKKCKLRVLIVVYREINRLKDVWAATDKSFLGEILKLCGAKNILEDIDKPYERISLEEIVARNPDVIIEASSRNLGIDSNKSLILWSKLDKINAVRYKRIYVLSKPYITIPGPRIPLIARDFINCLYADEIEK
ncbi:ABC transporter substrate-binding protein [Desulfothermus sp.]